MERYDPNTVVDVVAVEDHHRCSIQRAFQQTKRCRQVGVVEMERNYAVMPRDDLKEKAIFRWKNFSTQISY